MLPEDPNQSPLFYAQALKNDVRRLRGRKTNTKNDKDRCQLDRVKAIVLGRVVGVTSTSCLFSIGFLRLGFRQTWVYNSDDGDSGRWCCSVLPQS